MSQTFVPYSYRPPFIDKLSQAHFAALARCTVLTGNIYDLFPLEIKGDGVRFLTLEETLRESLEHAQDPTQGTSERFVVLTLKSNGLRFVSELDRDEFTMLAKGFESKIADEANSLAKNLSTCLEESAKERSSSLVTLTLAGELLRNVAKIRVRGTTVRPIAIIIDHANALFPNAEMDRLPYLDRETLKYFSDLLRDEEIWAGAETAAKKPDFIILLSPTAAEINRKILVLPKTVQIDIQPPDDTTRQKFIQRQQHLFPVTLEYPDGKNPVEELTRDSKGLTIRTLDDLMIRAHREQSSLERSLVMAEVNKYLERQLGKIINVVRPTHSFQKDGIGQRLKKRMQWLQERIDDPEEAPAGVVVVGPNGSGKTWTFEGFAVDTRRSVIELGNIRDQYYGNTDAFMQMFRSVTSVFDRLMVLVDEAHTAFGSIHDPNTHETEKRLTGHIIQMMDDEEARSRMFWVLMTTRPDLLDPDFLRSGRCSVVVPIFDPEGDEVEAFLGWLIKAVEKKGITLSGIDRQSLTARTVGFCAGDYKQFVQDFTSTIKFDPSVTLSDFSSQWKTTAMKLGDKRVLQNYLAALNCDWPEVLPEQFRKMERGQMEQEIERLKMKLAF